jgi:DNA polymerase III delta prime subunit
MTVSDFRPTTLDDIVGQPEIIRFLKAVCKGPIRDFPHCNLYGPPGTGKTTAAYAIGHELLGDFFEGNFFALNASDERGIKTVQDRIIPWLGQLPQGEARRKIVFLDEADKLTPDAQSALRAPIEEYEADNLFIFACNEVQRLIPPLRDSRLFPLGFRPLKDADLRELLLRVGELAGIAPDPKRIDAAIRHARGDARRAISVFQNEFGEGDKFLRLDEEIRKVFDTATGAKDQRLLRFLGFLREEGFTNWEEVLSTIAHMGRDGLLPLGDRRPQFVANAVQFAWRCSMVQLPLFQVEGFLVNEVP